MRRRSVVVVLVLVVVLALAWAVTSRRGGGDEVDVAEAERRAEFRSFVTASGEIVADRFADIGSSVMGRVVELRVKEGQQVRAGEVLARLDPVQARSAAEAARAQATALSAERDGSRQQLEAAGADHAAATARAVEARANRARVEQLFAAQLVAAGERDAAQAAADAAEAQARSAEASVRRAEAGVRSAERRVAQAQAQAAGAGDLLAQTDITAPIDGVVTRLQVREGEMVVVGLQNQPGTTLMTISDLSAVNAEIEVAEADVLRIVIGQPATVTLEALPGSQLPGRVIEIGTSALATPVAASGSTAAAREFRVVVRIDSVDAGLRPGLTCDAEILTDRRTDVVVVPLQTVVVRPAGEGAAERTGVFVVRDGRAVFTPVAAGVIGGLDIEVDGLEAGTRIVSGPFQVLRTLEDGAAVVVR